MHLWTIWDRVGRELGVGCRETPFEREDWICLVRTWRVGEYGRVIV